MPRGKIIYASWMAKKANTKSMKLAEALILRSDMQTKLSRLRERIVANAVIQEGSEPHEDAELLIKEAMGLMRDLERLIIRINKTNSVGTLSDGRTLTEAMAERDTLKAKHSLLLAATDANKQTPDLYSVREIRWIPQLDVSKLHKQADDVSKQIRVLNTKIQEADWQITLED